MPYGVGMEDTSARIEVPDVVGMTTQKAHALCRDLGLFLGYFNLDQQLPRHGVIAHQEPPAGTMASAVAAVRVWTTLDPLPDDRRPQQFAP